MFIESNLNNKNNEIFVENSFSGWLIFTDRVCIYGYVYLVVCCIRKESRVLKV